MKKAFADGIKHERSQPVKPAEIDWEKLEKEFYMHFEDRRAYYSNAIFDWVKANLPSSPIKMPTEEEIKKEAKYYAQIESANGSEQEIRHASDDFYNGANWALYRLSTEQKKEETFTKEMVEKLQEEAYQLGLKHASQ